MEKILKKLTLFIASSTLLFSVSNANAHHHGYSKSHPHMCKHKTHHPHHKNYRHHGNRYAPRAGIIDFITQSPGLSALLGALTQADLTNTLSTEGPFTVFAPNNAAFNALTSEQKEAVTSNPTLLSSILKAHVAKGAYTSKDLIEGKTLTTLAGNQISLSDINIERADIKLRNGVLHVIKDAIAP